MEFKLPKILPIKKFIFLITANTIEKVLKILQAQKLIDDAFEWLIEDAHVICLANDIYSLLKQKIINKDNFKIRMYDLLYKRGIKVNVTLTCITSGVTQDIDTFNLQNTPYIQHSYTNVLEYSDYNAFKSNKNDGSLWNIQPSELPYKFITEHEVVIGSWIFINKEFYPQLVNTFGTEEKVLNRWLLSLFTNDNNELISETDNIFFYRIGSAFAPNMKLRTNDNANLIDNNLLLHDGGGWIIGYTPKLEEKILENSSFILEKTVLVANYEPFKPLQNNPEFSVFSIIENDKHTFLTK
jgi:hypothetical protein